MTGDLGCAVAIIGTIFCMFLFTIKEAFHPSRTRTKVSPH